MNNFNKKSGLIYAAAMMAVTVIFTGCGTRKQEEAATGTEVEEKIQIGLSMYSYVIERWTRDRDMFISTAEELGAEVNVQNANGDVQEQIEQIEYLIQKGMDVIDVIAVDREQLTDVIEKARSKGIRIVCYDRIINDAEADLFISFDNVRVGELMGETMCERLPDGGNVYVINGPGNDNNVTMIRQGFEAAIKESSLKVVYSAECDNWRAELASDYAAEALKKEPDVAGIMCGNDDLASQVINVLSENRLAGRVVVTAQDAELSACQRIVEGTQAMTVYKPVETLAKTAAELSVALARGEDITSEDYENPVRETISNGTYEIPYYRIEPVAVTAENMQEIIIDGGFHSAEDVYLNVKG